MDNRECKFPFFDICYRLFHFIMKILSSKAQEIVTLGNQVSRESTASSQEIGSCNSQEEQKKLHLIEENDSYVTPSHSEDKNDLNANDGQKTEEETTSLTSTPKRAPRKIVSIKETVEDIDSIMKERRKSKGTKKSKSFDFDNRYDGSLKPTRSILKVGSIDDKSDLLNSLNHVG